MQLHSELSDIATLGLSINSLPVIHIAFRFLQASITPTCHKASRLQAGNNYLKELVFPLGAGLRSGNGHRILCFLAYNSHCHMTVFYPLTHAVSPLGRGQPL